jgi:hypothetical protein
VHLPSHLSPKHVRKLTRKAVGTTKMGDDSELVGYLVVKVKGSDPDGEPEMLDIFGNEQFYLGRNESLW